MNRFRLCLAIAGAMVMLTATAKADVVNFNYDTTGTLTGMPSALSFTGATNRSATTQDDPLAQFGFGRAGYADNITLGTFTLANTSTDDSTGSFSLLVDFNLPAGVTGNPNDFVSTSISVNANLVYLGFIGSSDDRFTITFTDTWETLNFSGVNGVGSFQFRVDDLEFTRSNGGAATGTLTGDIRNADITGAPVTGGAVPEPQSIMLLLTAVAGVALTAKKKFLA